MNVRQKQKKQPTTAPARRRRNRRRRGQNRLPTVTPGFVKLSNCVRHFILATVNPFANLSELPCIPDLTIIPSNKIVTKVKGNFQTGTAGHGFVMFNPFLAATNDNGLSGANCDYPIVYTGTTYPGSTSQFVVAGGAFTTVGVAGANSNSPYSFANINGLRTLRLVAAGLKIQYTGSNFKNQGQVQLYRTPNNGAITANNDDFAEKNQDNYTRVIPVSRRTEYVFFNHAGPDLTFYQPTTFFYPSIGGLDRRGCLTIHVVGGDTESPQTWMFEAVAFFELLGPGLPLSPSHSDPVGYGAALASMPGRAPAATPSEVVQSVITKTIDNVANSVSGFVTNRVIPAAANAALNYALGGQPVLTGPTITEI